MSSTTEIMNSLKTPPRVKRIHLARFYPADGVVALCFKRCQRTIDLQVASWTNRHAAVTCPRCKAIMSRMGRGKASREP